MLIAPVGDGWSPARWLDRPDAAEFDIIAIYHGEHSGNFSCGACAAVFHIEGPKWRLYLAMTQAKAWAAIAAKYEWIMLPDDDLHMGESGSVLVDQNIDENS